MSPRRFIFVIVGMLIPVAYARAPQALVQPPVRPPVLPSPVQELSETAARQPRKSAESLRRIGTDASVHPVYASDSPR